MNCYRIRINGQNFLLNLNGTLTKFGFYTTRDIKAESLENAETIAVQLIENDEALISQILNDRTDSPMTYIDEIRVLEIDEERLKNFGYSFYVEEE